MPRKRALGVLLLPTSQTALRAHGLSEQHTGPCLTLLPPQPLSDVSLFHFLLAALLVSAKVQMSSQHIKSCLVGGSCGGDCNHKVGKVSKGNVSRFLYLRTSQSSSYIYLDCEFPRGKQEYSPSLFYKGRYFSRHSAIDSGFRDLFWHKNWPEARGRMGEAGNATPLVRQCTPFREAECPVAGYSDKATPCSSALPGVAMCLERKG